MLSFPTEFSESENPFCFSKSIFFVAVDTAGTELRNHFENFGLKYNSFPDRSYNLSHCNNDSFPFSVTLIKPHLSLLNNQKWKTYFSHGIWPGIQLYGDISVKDGSRGSRFTYVHSIASQSGLRHALAMKTGPKKKIRHRFRSILFILYIFYAFIQSVQNSESRMENIFVYYNYHCTVTK